MTDLLVKLFVKNYQQTDDIRVRERYGTLSSIVGIVCNVLLFILKYFIGTITASISIISDAFNNLSDSASCIITLIGYKASAKPADKEHPFGHGRAEYLTSMIISVMILLVGFELMKSSGIKLFSDEKVQFSVGALISLVISICMKFWMFLFNHKLGKRIDSSVMLATAQDSRNDMLATAAALIGLTSSLFTDLPVDACMGIFVAMFIMKAGIDITKETMNALLGKPADIEQVRQMEEILLRNERIIGVHDLILHDYGPGRMIASCHAEVKSTEDIIQIHEIIDAAERDIFQEMNILMTIHLDPIDVDNPLANALRERVTAIVSAIDSRMSIHDFRITSGDKAVNLIFDTVIPYEIELEPDEIKKRIDAALKENQDGIDYYTVITFDREFIE
ncbi:MAG: cation diffusion facilitator family transporter [Oscillospiraceae bacterium]|nr:cation diffusion facilitator family transporter [Oscillospiraceae bacterium]